MTHGSGVVLLVLLAAMLGVIAWFVIGDEDEGDL